MTHKIYYDPERDEIWEVWPEALNMACNTMKWTGLIRVIDPYDLERLQFEYIGEL